MRVSGHAQGTSRGRRDASTRRTGSSADCARRPSCPRASCCARPSWPAHTHTQEVFMIGRVAALIYGLVSYLVFFLTNLYAMGFVGNYLVPKSIDIESGSESGLAHAILVDVLLLGLF